MLLMTKRYKGCGEYYNILSMIVDLPTAQIRWSAIINDGSSPLIWKTVYLTSRLCTKQIALIDFRYKILNRVIATNSFLCKIGFRDDVLCTFCKDDEETITHLFVKCSKVIFLWRNLDFVCSWFSYNYKQ